MRYLVIDRFEEKFVICEGDEERMFAIPTDEVPEGSKEGDVIAIDDEGNICIDTEETQRRRAAALAKKRR